MKELKTFFKIKASYEPTTEGYGLVDKMGYWSSKIFFSLDEVKAELTRLVNSIDCNCEIPLSSKYLGGEKGTVETKPIDIKDFQENYIPELFYVVKTSFFTANDGSTHQRKDKYTIVSKGSNQYNLILEG